MFARTATTTETLDPLHPHAQRIEAALRSVGLGCGVISFLAQGANNSVYSLVAGDLNLVAKIGINPAFQRLHVERSFLESNPGIGPRCLTLETQEGSGSQLLIQERLAGTHPTELGPEDLAALGRLLRCYHELPWSEGLEQDTWQVFLEKRVLAMPRAFGHPRLMRAYEMLYPRVLALGHALDSKVLARASTLVHGDLIPLNLLRDEQGRFRIIDWEGLRLDEPEADIASLFKAYRCSPAARQSFLEAYGPGLRPERLRLRTLLHYMQVIAWRLACQWPMTEGPDRDKALQEALEELDWVSEEIGRSGG